MKLCLVGLALFVVACGTRTEHVEPSIEYHDHVAPNACGGSTDLAGAPGDACGPECGVLRCDGPESLVCVAGTRNACGACGPLPVEECNGRDDDCDGKIDDDCVERVGTANASRVVFTGSRVAWVGPDSSKGYGTSIVGTYDFLDDSTWSTTVAGNVPDIAASGSSIGYSTSGYFGAIVVQDTASTSPPATLTAHGATAPALDGRQALYFDMPTWDGAPNLFLWSADGGTPKQIASGRSVARYPGTEDTPVLSGHWAVIVERTRDAVARGRIVAIHTETGATTELTASLDASFSYLRPSISGTRVVFESASATAGPIYLVDLADEHPAPRVLVAAPASEPRLDGNVLCYTDPQGVMAMNVTTGKTVRVGSGHGCDVSGKRIVFLEDRYGAWSGGGIYTRTIRDDEL